VWIEEDIQKKKKKEIASGLDSNLDLLGSVGLSK
jgi:hypothetical protein